MQTAALGLCLFVGMISVGPAQTFEVASFKVSESFRQGTPGSRRADITCTPDTVIVHDTGLTSIIIWAFSVSPYQLANGPTKDSERYDIIAKAPARASVDQMRLMMQSLLRERLKLVIHRETRLTPAYALVEAKGGHKLSKRDEDTDSDISSEPGKWILRGRGVTLDRLAMYLSDPLRMPVMDMTGLKGRYTFELDISNFVPKDPLPGEPAPDPVSIFQAALPKQLGLRLEARKLPVETVVIDRYESIPIEQ